MASDLIDWTLPAHDPNFPKPRGLLPVPPEVAESVARTEARLLRERGIQITPEARQRDLEYQTLNWYFDNTEVAYRRHASRYRGASRRLGGSLRIPEGSPARDAPRRRDQGGIDGQVRSPR